MIILLFVSLISIAVAQSDQKIVTGFDCESSSSSTRQWHDTKYGPNGGTLDGFGSSEGRLFEFDCQTSSCRDSEGESGHWWVTCGYSWKSVNDLSDSDLVVVDVKTEASNSFGSCEDSSYIRALDIDSTGWKARDSQGDRGHWGFWFCYKQESWADVKNSEMDVVTDLTARTSSSEVTWTHAGYGGCSNGNWRNLGNANSIEEAQAMMLADDICSQPGSMMFYSDYSYAWGVRCVTSEQIGDCQEQNPNWREYILTSFTHIGRWDTHNGGQAKAYGDNKMTSGWMHFFSKKEQPVVQPGAAQCSNPPANHGDLDTRTRYQDESVNAPASCISQTQTRECSQGEWGAWSGSFAHSSCDVKAQCSNPPANHGDLDARTRYQDESVNAPASCISQTQTRECSHGEWGTWSGSFAHSSCDVKAECFNPTTNHGDSLTRTRYQQEFVEEPASCISETQSRTCSDGVWSSWSGSFENASCDVLDAMTYFWDNDWPSDTEGGLDATVLFAQSQIFPSKHGIAGDSQPHLTARRKALVLFRPHEAPLSGDVSITVRDIDGNTLSTTTMNEPKDIPKQVGWIEVENVPEFPSSLVNPYVISGQSNLDLVDDETAVFLASKFSDQNNNGVEVKYWDGSWSKNLYLPNGNDVPAGSKVQVTCNSGYNVHVKYPNTVTGGWRVKILSRGDTLILVLTDNKVWVAKADLEHNAYLFGKDFYSSTLDAEWVKPGMTLEFQQGNQVGTLEDIEIGAVTEVLIPTLDAGFLTPPRGKFSFADDATAHREYFQTLPVSRLVVAQYEPLHLSEVMLPTGKLYQTKSDDDGGWHSGDMRQFTGKILLSHGIDLANYGIFSSSGRSESSHPFTCAQMTAHNTRGYYQNGVKVHGGSGGNGMVTLDSSIGNEFSHELGHNYGLGHYVGGFEGSVHRSADEIDSSWQWDSELNLFTPNFASKDTGSDQCLHGKCQSAFMGKYQYGTDSMAGGSPQWGANRFTFYTPYVAKRIQDFLESKAVWDPTSSTGFRKFDSTTKKMAEFANQDNGHKVPLLYRVPVTTIVGYYDPNANRGGGRLQSYIFPAMYGAYGFVYDDEAVSGDACSLHVETATRGTLVFGLSTSIDPQGMNKFHVNVATEWGATKAEIYCQNEILATRILEGPQNPNLAYTVNGVPFDDESDNEVTWTYAGVGGCSSGNWRNLGNANSIEEAQEMMLADDICSQPGSMMFYSDYSYAWGVRCVTSEQIGDCQEQNPNWREYILTYGSRRSLSPSKAKPKLGPRPPGSGRRILKQRKI